MTPDERTAAIRWSRLVVDDHDERQCRGCTTCLPCRAVLAYVPPGEAQPPTGYLVEMLPSGLPPLMAREHGPSLLFYGEDARDRRSIRLRNPDTMRTLAMYLIAQADAEGGPR